MQEVRVAEVPGVGSQGSCRQRCSRVSAARDAHTGRWGGAAPGPAAQLSGWGGQGGQERADESGLRCSRLSLLALWPCWAVTWLVCPGLWSGGVPNSPQHRTGARRATDRWCVRLPRPEARDSHTCSSPSGSGLSRLGCLRRVRPSRPRARAPGRVGLRPSPCAAGRATHPGRGLSAQRGRPFPKCPHGKSARRAVLSGAAPSQRGGAFSDEGEGRA